MKELEERSTPGFPEATGEIHIYLFFPQTRTTVKKPGSQSKYSVVNQEINLPLLEQ